MKQGTVNATKTSKNLMASFVVVGWWAMAGVMSAQAQQTPPQNMPGVQGGPGGPGVMQGGPGMIMRGQQRNPEAIKEVLDLSDRQFAEMTELRAAHQAKLKEYSDQQRALEAEKRAILASSGADPVKLGSITLRQEGLTQMIQQENAAYHTGSLALLTATQRDKVAAIEEAVKLAPKAGSLMQFGLLDTKALGLPGGFMGMPPGQGFGGQRGGPGQN